jgi:hypothetical protein
MVDALARVALGELERAVRAVGRGPVVGDGALDDAPDEHSPHPMMAISRPVYSPTSAVILEVPISTAPMKVCLMSSRWGSQFEGGKAVSGKAMGPRRGPGRRRIDRGPPGTKHRGRLP